MMSGVILLCLAVLGFFWPQKKFNYPIFLTFLQHLMGEEFNVLEHQNTAVLVKVICFFSPFVPNFEQMYVYRWLDYQYEKKSRK